MKIVLVAYLHGNGGAERQIIMLSNEMAEKGHEVHLAVLAENNVKYPISPKVQVHICTEQTGGTFKKIRHRYLVLKELFHDISPEITIHYWLQSVYLTAFMPKQLRGKIIYSERGDPGDREYHGVLSMMRWFAFRYTDAFVFQSEGARDFFGNHVKTRSIVIHNSVSVPVDKYLELPKYREKRIVSVGRLHQQKNQRLLINAFSKVSPKFPEYRLEIYGDGELKEELTQLIDEIGLADKIILKGTSNAIFDCIYNASLFVLTSDFEGMPNALMEAMALGLPCISTDCRPGGARTLIKDGENGYIVPIGDMEILANTMESLLKNKEKAEELAKNAQKIRITNSCREIFDKWDWFIKNTVERR